MLTNAQYQTLRTAIAAVPELENLPDNPDKPYAVAAYYSAAPASPFTAWNSQSSVNAVLDAIDFSKYTPNDAADSTTIYLNRALLAQTKQMNLQLLTMGRTTLDASKTTIRASLRDAVISVPTGTSGAATAPGGASGVNVLNACTRQTVTRLENLFASAPVATGTVSAVVMAVEGPLSVEDAANALTFAP